MLAGGRHSRVLPVNRLLRDRPGTQPNQFSFLITVFSISLTNPAFLLSSPKRLRNAKKCLTFYFQVIYYIGFNKFRLGIALLLPGRCCQIQRTFLLSVQILIIADINSLNIYIFHAAFDRKLQSGSEIFSFSRLAANSSSRAFHLDGSTKMFSFPAASRGYFCCILL